MDGVAWRSHWAARDSHCCQSGFHKGTMQKTAGEIVVNSFSSGSIVEER